MFALVDCNNFYASCERAFNPYWNNRPVVVLSNNDGCVIARSNEAKALGIKMGVPAYQIKTEIEQYNIGVFSSNYTLYGDMSNRVMTLLSSYSPNIELYSIDECFLDFSGFGSHDLKEEGETIVRTVTKGTGIPISMGIAKTKTLAKVANKFAKKYKGYKGVCIIDTEQKRIEALKHTEIGDIWGIGRRNAGKLEKFGIKNAYDFSLMPRNWVRQQMTVVGERTWKELNGEPCIDLETTAPPKKEICTSRAFGEMVTEMNGLEEAVSNFASICAAKLRKQKSCAQSLMVFIHTNNFREDMPQYFKNCVIKLPVPTDSTLEIVHYALTALRHIFQKGYWYKKAGVIIMDIVPAGAIQQHIFDTVDRTKQHKLMEVMDRLNNGFTKNNLTLAIQGGSRKWKLKQESLSPCYTTKLKDVININCR